MSSRSPTELDRAIGRRIREARQRAGLSLAELGRAIGVTQQQAQKYEAGDDRISAGRLVLVAVALGLTPAELLPPIATQETSHDQPST